MTDSTDFSLVNLSTLDECDSSSCYVPRKKIKLTPTKNRNARSLTEKASLVQPQTNSWKFIDKNETMIAELSGGKLTLWQFLLELLMADEYSSLIKWTDRNIGEFILIQAEEVAKLWGIRKDRNHRMNYDKLSRALRYYYQKNIIKKVHGHKFVYRFVSLVPETIAGSSPYIKNGSPINGNISPQNQTNLPLSDAESSSNENLNQRSQMNRLLSSIPNTIRSATKNNKKTDFNSTLTALFQAALLSLSGSNSEIPPSLFLNHKDSESRVSESETRTPESTHNIEHTLNRTQNFDGQKQSSTTLQQECICKPDVLPTTTGMFFPSPSGPTSSIHIPPFDRQSMLHFSRHSINMQRLSQEILLQATSKSRFNPSLSNPLISAPIETVNSPADHSNHNFWLNRFATDLYKSTVSGNNCDEVIVPNSLNVPPSSPISNDLSKVKIKVEKYVDSGSNSETKEDTNSLTALFKRFVKEFENIKGSSSSSSATEEQQFNHYSHTNLANLIKSQLSSHSSFVWMPVPVNFAEEIMDFCVRSLNNHSP